MTEKLQLSAAKEIDESIAFVDSVVARLGVSASAVIPILQSIQEHYRYLPEEALRRVCEITEITPATIVGVASFYSQFRHRPVGRAPGERVPRDRLPCEGRGACPRCHFASAWGFGGR